MRYDKEGSLAREISAKRDLFLLGWICLGCWQFLSPSNTQHDLSAADLTQLDRIDKDGLFLVE